MTLILRSSEPLLTLNTTKKLDLTFSFVELLTTSISRGRVLVVAKYSTAGS